MLPVENKVLAIAMSMIHFSILPLLFGNTREFILTSFIEYAIFSLTY